MDQAIVQDPNRNTNFLFAKIGWNSLPLGAHVRRVNRGHIRVRSRLIHRRRISRRGSPTDRSTAEDTAEGQDTKTLDDTDAVFSLWR